MGFFMKIINKLGKVPGIFIGIDLESRAENINHQRLLSHYMRLSRLLEYI
jgi:hypothetical protein